MRVTTKFYAGVLGKLIGERRQTSVGSVPSFGPHYHQTPLTKCRLNRHFVTKAERHEGQAARGLPLGFLNSERFRCF